MMHGLGSRKIHAPRYIHPRPVVVVVVVVDVVVVVVVVVAVVAIVHSSYCSYSLCCSFLVVVLRSRPKHVM